MRSPLRGLARQVISVVVLFSCGLLQATEPVPPVVGNLQSPWENAKLRGVKFRAIGQEPSWFMEIKDGEGIYLFKAFGALEKRLPFIEPVVDPDRKVTQFQYPVEAIEIELRGEPCNDTMSGEQFSVTVVVKVSGDRLAGCGRALF